MLQSVKVINLSVVTEQALSLWFPCWWQWTMGAFATVQNQFLAINQVDIRVLISY